MVEDSSHSSVICHKQLIMGTISYETCFFFRLKTIVEIPGTLNGFAD